VRKEVRKVYCFHNLLFSLPIYPGGKSYAPIKESSGKNVKKYITDNWYGMAIPA
jgi:hypothetical protein